MERVMKAAATNKFPSQSTCNPPSDIKWLNTHSVLFAFLVEGWRGADISSSMALIFSFIHIPLLGKRRRSIACTLKAARFSMLCSKQPCFFSITPSYYTQWLLHEVFEVTRWIYIFVRLSLLSLFPPILSLCLSSHSSLSLSLSSLSPLPCRM